MDRWPTDLCGALDAWLACVVAQENEIRCIWAGLPSQKISRLSPLARLVNVHQYFEGGNGRPREKDMQAQKVTRRAYGWPDADDEARPRGMRLGKYTLRMLRHLQDPRGCHLRASVYGVCLFRQLSTTQHSIASEIQM